MMCKRCGGKMEFEEGAWICQSNCLGFMTTPQSQMPSKEWFKQSAAIEGDSEVGAGCSRQSQTPETDVFRKRLYEPLSEARTCQLLIDCVDSHSRLEISRNEWKKVAEERQLMMDRLAFDLACCHKETGCQSQCGTVALLNEYQTLKEKEEKK